MSCWVVVAMASRSAFVGWGDVVVIGVGGEGVGVGVGGCVRRGFSVVRSGRALGAALTAVKRWLDVVGGVVFD